MFRNTSVSFLSRYRLSPVAESWMASSGSSNVRLSMRYWIGRSGLVLIIAVSRVSSMLLILCFSCRTAGRSAPARGAGTLRPAARRASRGEGSGGGGGERVGEGRPRGRRCRAPAPPAPALPGRCGTPAPSATGRCLGRPAGRRGRSSSAGASTGGPPPLAKAQCRKVRTEAEEGVPVAVRAARGGGEGRGAIAIRRPEGAGRAGPGRRGHHTEDSVQVSRPPTLDDRSVAAPQVR